MDVAIHINPALPHQRDHGEWLRKGFLKHGVSCCVTADVTQPADVHIISGPWYAKRHWLGHARTVLLDRCYYRGDPDSVSLGWMRPDGGRSFQIGSGRQPPVAKDRRNNGRSIFLADYIGAIEQADTVRLHPTRETSGEGLVHALRRHGRAIGYYTTALATAGLEGLEVECLTDGSVMSYPNWLELLPYADWHHTDIENGDAWAHLALSHNLL